VRACRHPEERHSLARKARAYVRRHFSFVATAEDLLAWAQEPRLAPDNEEKHRLFPGHASPRTVTLHPQEEEAMLVELNDVQELARQAVSYQRIQRRLLYRAWKAFGRLFGGSRQAAHHASGRRSFPEKGRPKENVI